MKICWDTLDGIRLIKNKYFRKGTSTYVFVDSCIVCGDPFLTEKTRPSATCSSSCGLKGMKWESHRRELQSKRMIGVNNYNYKGGVKMHGKVVYATYNHKINFCEETRRDPDNSIYMQVRCSVCKKWFNPSVIQICSRIRSINGISGVDKFYCSDECKSSCGVYKRRIHYKNFSTNDLEYTSSELSIWREEVLKRVSYKCEYCGKDAIIAHHERPKKLEPFFALDPDYGVACCEECHYIYGHRDECSTGILAKEICT